MSTKFIAAVTLFGVSLLLGNPDPERRMHNELNLTDTQQEQFEKISFDMKKKQIEMKAKLETARLELRRLFNAESIDKSAIEKKMNDIAAQHVALRMNHINAWSEKNKVLNADQQKIWKKMLDRHPRAMRGNHRGPRMMYRERMMDRGGDDDDMPPRMERRIEKKIIND